MKKILIVEDDDILRNNLEEILNAENFKVIVAKDGEEGFKKAKEYFPDLIISDVMMPKLNGYELLEKLQEDNDLSTIPFVFLTAKTDKEDLRFGMNLGADDYLEKPFLIDELLLIINKRLEKKERIDKKIIDTKDNLTRKIPHELRTPLVGVMGYSDLLIDNIENLSKEELKEIATNLKNSSLRLDRRIEKFLLYSELLSDELKIYEKENGYKFKTNFNTQFVTSTIFPIFKENKLLDKVVLDIQTAELNIYDKYLEIILKEFTDNAIKYSIPNTKIEVLGYYTIDTYKIVFRNLFDSDNKIISTKIEPFKTLTNEKYLQEGVGLGLAIAKKILEDANGDLNIKIIGDKFSVIANLKLADLN